VNYHEAERVILAWQAEHVPVSTIVLLDQPTIVMNATGQRPVEHIISSVVCRRYGGMQPANTAKAEMFGAQAPVWSFVARFGGAADALAPSLGAQIYETYPVLTMISLGWTVPDSRPAGRLPKYNPERTRTFSIIDWEHVCIRARDALMDCGLLELSQWIGRAAQLESPRKRDQDRLDACLCLLAALQLVEGEEGLMVGDQRSGYIITVDNAMLRRELEDRCRETGRTPSEWVRVFQLTAPGRPLAAS
jgi:predicted RNase H-like nuclease